MPKDRMGKARLNVELGDDVLFEAIKTAAVRRGQPLRTIVKEALEEWLERQEDDDDRRVIDERRDQETLLWEQVKAEIMNTVSASVITALSTSKTMPPGPSQGSASLTDARSMDGTDPPVRGALPMTNEVAGERENAAGGVRHVRVEAISWVTRFVGGNGTRRVSFEEAAASGDSLRDVLRHLSARYPQLHEALWDPKSGDLGEHIEVMVNNAVLGVERGLDGEVREGDVVTLVGQYMGG